ncbi:DMT family transporter [Fulvivirgaceae bacterium LMO-SS25]
MNKDQDAPSLLAWSLLIILALIWGTSFILIKKGLLFYSAVELGAFRIFSASIVMLPIAIKQIRGLVPRQIRWLIFAGFTGSFLPAFLFAIAQTNLDSSVSGALNALTPIFALLLGALLFHQAILKKSLLGISIGFVGTLILIFTGSGGEIGDLNLHVFYVIAATFCYGLNVNIIKYKLPKIKPFAIASISISFMMPISATVLFGFTPFYQHVQEGNDALIALGYIALLGVVGTGFALILFNKLVQLTNPIFTSTVTYVIPIVALFWGIIDGEKLLIGQIIGMLAIIMGVFIANRKTKVNISNAQVAVNSSSSKNV